MFRLSQWGLGGGGGGGVAIFCGYWPLQVFLGWVGVALKTDYF